MNKTDASTMFGTFENPPEQQNFMDSFLTNKKRRFRSARGRQRNILAGRSPRKIFANCTGDKPWLPHAELVARGRTKAWQCSSDGWNVDPSSARGACGPGRTIFCPFVPQKFRTPPNVVEPENVPDLMSVEAEVPEVGEAADDPPINLFGQ